MKSVSPILLALLVLVPVIAADQLRVREVRGGNTFDVAYATIRIQRGQAVLEARTDKYGRATFNLPPGTYDAEITRDGRTLSVKVIFDGTSNLKPVFVN